MERLNHEKLYVVECLDAFMNKDPANDWERLNGDDWRYLYFNAGGTILDNNLVYDLTIRNELSDRFGIMGFYTYGKGLFKFGWPHTMGIIGPDQKVIAQHAPSTDRFFSSEDEMYQYFLDLLPKQNSIENEDKSKTLQITNYPNPFNPVTNINYELRMMNDELINLSVYNANGQLVKMLVDGKQKAGSYSVKFDGSDLNSGVYYYKLTAGNNVLTNKMILIK